MWKSLACCNTLCKWTNCMIIRYYLIKFKTYSFIIILTKPMCPCVSFSNERPRTWEHPGWLPQRAHRDARGMTVIIIIIKERAGGWNRASPLGFPPGESTGHNLCRLTSAYMPLVVYWNSDHREFTEAPGLQTVLESVVPCSGALGPQGARKGRKNVCDKSGNWKQMSV